MLPLATVEYCQLPVTALQFCARSELLLAGKGPYLYIFRGPKYECIWVKKLFKDRAIHGITSFQEENARDVFLIWGGSNVLFIAVSNSISCKDNSEFEVAIGEVCICEDWIIKCCFRPKQHSSSNRPYGAAITAHNALVLLKVAQSESPGIGQIQGLQICQQILSAATQSILYSADMAWVSSTKILVAGGTPFGQIILWTVHLGASTNSTQPLASVKVDNVWIAHPDAAVFGTKIVEADFNANKLPSPLVIASCSDDRTIKLWHLRTSTGFQSLDKDTNLDEAGHSIEASDTISLAARVENTTTPLCIAKINPAGRQTPLGHISRIWAVDIITSRHTNKAIAGQPLLVSIGEDATSQIWQMVPFASSELDLQFGELSHLFRFAGHAGKNIWSHSWSWDSSNAVVLALGGADGGITLNLLNARSLESFPRAKSLSEPFADDRETTDKRRDIWDWTNMLKTYSFVDSTTLLATTHEGQVLLGNTTSKDLQSTGLSKSDCTVSFEFECIGEIEDLRQYSTISTLPALKIGFVAGTSGDIYLVANRRLWTEPICQLNGKVSSLLAQSSTEDVLDDNELPKTYEASANIALIASQLGSNSIRLFHLKLDLPNHTPDIAQLPANCQTKQHESLRSVRYLDIPKPKSAIPTCILHLKFDQLHSWLFVGFRDGSVTKYILSEDLRDRSEDHTPAEKPRVRLVESMSSTHHHEAVTSMEWSTWAPRQKKHAYGYLLSTGRDSAYAIYRFSLIDAASPPELVHRLELPFGPNIEGCYLSGPEKTLMFYGFRSEDFVLYDARTNTEKLQVRCGGAHRTWTFLPPSDASGNVQFAWTRASEFQCYRASLSNTLWVNQGIHGREIKASAVCPFKLDNSEEPSSLVATGAEDTDIRLLEYSVLPNSAQPKLSTSLILRKHSTGLQHLQWSADGQYLFSSGGREELLVWRIQRAPFVRVGVFLESSLTAISEARDLRVMGFDVCYETGSDRRHLHASFLITLALSNSTTRCYRYPSDPSRPSWEVLSSGTYNASCLTYLRHLPSGSGGGAQRELAYVAGATDGCLTFWNQSIEARIDSQNISEELLNPVYSIKAFQNAIKCFTVIPCQSGESVEGNLHVLLGCGDDNAIGISILREASAQAGDAMLARRENLRYASSTLVIPRAHAASINSIVAWKSSASLNYAQSSPECRIRMITVSNDQRLKVWDLVLNTQKPFVEHVRVKKLASLSSSVADASSLDIMDEQVGSDGEVYVRVIVCGVGVEVWRIPKFKHPVDSSDWRHE